ncbi:MAG: hypothetical protein QM644_07705 [Mobilitalea sp.]
MSNCEYCDYYRSVEAFGNSDSKKEECFCLFVGSSISKTDDTIETEYLCRDITYEEYQNKNKVKNDKLFKEYSWKILYEKQPKLPVEKTGEIPLAV